MKSRTSFFNATVLKKDITRFAPVWGLYSVGLLLLLLGIVDGTSLSIARELEDLCDLAVLIQLFYGTVCAAMLFGDLFNPRLCNALHAMPLRREGWFLNKLAAGLLFFLVPTGAFGLVLMLLTGAWWYAPLLFLVISFLAFLFFFGTGALCALCAGNRLGMIALYGILQFFSFFVYCLVWVFYEPFLYGLPLEAESFVHYSPVIALTDCSFLEFRFAQDIPYADAEIAFIRAEYSLEAWGYLGWTAGVGLLSLGLAVVLYRKRNLEAAGDFLAFRWVKPLFLGIYCLAVGMLLYLIGDAIGTGTQYVFLLVGLAVGFFTGRMLLRRTVRVFQGKAFLAFGLFLAILGISVGAVVADLFGIVRRVPWMNRIETVQISSDYGYQSVTLTGAEDIQTVRAVHENCLAFRDDTGSLTLDIRYTLKSGEVIHRRYPVSDQSRDKERLNRYFSSWQCVMGTENPEEFLSQVRDVEVEVGEYALWLTDAQLAGLLEAIRRDCDAGTMAQNYAFHLEEEESPFWIRFTLDTADGSGLRKYLGIRLCENSTNTRKFLEQLLTEYEIKLPEGDLPVG